MLCAVAESADVLRAILPKELRWLSMELALDALLDDPVFFAPFERFFDPGGWVGRRRLAPTEPARIRHHQAHRRRSKAGAQGASGWRRNPMARVMARPRRAVTQKHGGTAKGPLTRAFAVERVTRIELAWPAWKAGALPLSYTRVP